MRALVTGAAGHIGAFLVRGLIEHGFDVTRFDSSPQLGEDYICADVLDGESVARAFDRACPDVVYHLAARVGRLVCEQAHGLTLAANVDGTRTVASQALKHGARLIHVSTSEVYGPVDRMAEDAVCRPNNWYGITKLLGEQVVDYYRTMGLRAVVVRPFMMYHESERPEPHRSAMIRFAAAIARGEDVTIHEGAERGWLHYDDAVRFMCHLGSYRSALPAALNIGNADIRPMAELAALLARAMGRELKCRAEPLPGRVTASKRPDLTRQDALGLVPAVSLEAGVKRVARAVLRAI